MTQPPRLAAWLLHRSAPDFDRDAMLGDITEEFVTRCSREGRNAAARWYWRQTRRSLVPNVRRRFQSRVTVPQERRSMTALTQDFRLAFRALVRRPLYSTIGVLSLSLA